MGSRLEELFRRRTVCFALYALLVVASYYPQSLRPQDTFGYVGDSLYHIYQVAWTNHQLFEDPIHWYDANILYPNQRTFTFADHQLLPSLLVGPVFWATGNPVLAYNVGVFLASMLAAFGARRLAWRLGIDPIGAWATGALYAFHTYQINEAPRLVIIFHGFIPLALAELVAFLQEGKSASLWRLAVFMYLQALSASYHLVYGCFLVGLVTLAFLMAKPAQTLRRLPRLAAASLVAVVFYLPVFWPYAQNAADYGYARELPVGVDLAHYISTSPSNLWYGAIGAEVRVQQQGPHFIGFLTIGCALLALGVWACGRLPRSKDRLLPAPIWVPFAGGLALLFVLLSLGRDVVFFGKTLGPGPYRVLFHFVPGFQLIRIPERLGLIAMLFFSLLVGMALTLLRRRGFSAAALLLAFLVPLEHLSPLALTEQLPLAEEAPAVYAWLKQDRAKAVAEVPIHGEALLRKETLDMYFSTWHFKPIIHGYTAFPPMLARIMRRLAEQFPEDVSLDGFSRAGVDTVIVHLGRPQSDAIQGRLQAQSASGLIERVARFSGAAARVYEGTADEVYRIVGGPRLEAAPLPLGERLVETEWSYRTKVGDPLPATDGDLSTAWEVRRSLAGDEFFEVTFHRTVRTSGVLFRLRQDSLFPTSFKIAGRTPVGQWIPLSFYDAEHQLQLLERLLADPRNPVLGFDFSDQDLTGIRVMVEPGGHSALGWSIPEIEILIPS